MIRTTIPMLVLGLAILPILIKALFLEATFRSLMDIDFYGSEEVLQNDSIIYFTMLVCVYSSYLSRGRYLSPLLRTLSAVIWLFYIVDLWVLINFTTRLTVSDVIAYGAYAPAYLLQAYGLTFLLSLILALLVAVICYIFVLADYKVAGVGKHSIYLMLLSLLGLQSFLPNKDSYVNAWAYENFVTHNLKVRSVAKPYSTSFINNMSLKESTVCNMEEPMSKNIILLMVESLSSYQSSLFSGIKDWTPRLDEIARNNQYFTNFYANGYTTEAAELALLTGVLPITPPTKDIYDASSPFNGFSQFELSLPLALRSQGYQTEFITNSDLAFYQTGEWAKDLGFNYIEGHENTYYNGFSRYQFGAAPDKALYDRILQRISEQSSNYFMFVKTTSSHQPHINPDTNEKGEEQAFRYIDQELGVLYNRLMAMDYFADGVLIITGDHHVMVPLLQEEIDIYGPHRASAMVPLVVSYGDRESERKIGSFQHTDIYHGIKKLGTGESCRSKWIGDLLDGRFTAEYIAHSQGDDRQLVNVFRGSQTLFVQLDGDNTRLDNPESVEPLVAEEILRKINTVRVTRNFQSTMQ